MHRMPALPIFSTVFLETSMRWSSIACMTLALVLGFAADAAGRCKDKRGKPHVRVRAKTPLRRGPGLNYAVNRFIEKAKCVPFSEVSLDEQWVLIEVGTVLGWVPAKRLTKKSRRRIARVGTSGPVGSGQSRASSRVVRSTVMMERPDANAPVRRVLPKNLRILPLSVTRSGRWTQVRDERGDVGWVASKDIADGAAKRLPRTGAASDRVVRRAAPSRSTRRPDALVAAASPRPSAGEGAADEPEVDAATVSLRPVPSTGTIGLEVTVFGAALNPVHSLDSNGVPGFRRYDLSALAAGTGFEVEARDLGPIDVRLGYTIAFLSGLSSEEAPGAGEAGGMQHDAFVRVGLPFDLGRLRLAPEIGYHFGMFDFDEVLSQQQVLVFLSTQSHVATVGLRAQFALREGWSIDADASGLFGVTQESPQDLGEAGLTFGFAGQAGTRVDVADGIRVVARYAVNYRSTAYSGQAQLDSTITEATLVDLTHGLLAGVAFDL